MARRGYRNFREASFKVAADERYAIHNLSRDTQGNLLIYMGYEDPDTGDFGTQVILRPIGKTGLLLMAQKDSVTRKPWCGVFVYYGVRGPFYRRPVRIKFMRSSALLKSS